MTVEGAECGFKAKVQWVSGDFDLFHDNDALIIKDYFDKINSENKKISENEFLFGKRDFVLNTLLVGVAIEVIYKLSPYPPDAILKYLTKEAEKRMACQTPESIEEAINDYYISKQNKAKVSLINFHKPA